MEQEQLATVNQFKFPGPVELHPQVLKEFADVVNKNKPLSGISWTQELVCQWQQHTVPRRLLQGRRNPRLQHCGLPNVGFLLVVREAARGE